MRLLPFFEIFFDPILAAPMWGTIAVCLSASLIGVLLVVRREALLGEAISHTTYLGVATAIYASASWLTDAPWFFPVVVLVGASFSGWLGLKFIERLRNFHRLSSDSALCFVLSTFLGLGILVGSRLQFTHPIWQQKVQMFLYGQAATITMTNVNIYCGLSVLIGSVLWVLYYQLTSIFFEREYAIMRRMPVALIESVMHTLLIAAIVIGIRSVGVLMMSGMLIAPAAAAKTLARRFSHMFIFAALFGILSAIGGNFTSVYLSELLSESLPGFRVTFATGPMILINAVTLTMICLLFMGKSGFIKRQWRRRRFSHLCNQENILKALYKRKGVVSPSGLSSKLGWSFWYICFLLTSLRLQRKVEYLKGKCQLTSKGEVDAERIIRLHRLWEVYLVSELGMHASQVHQSAEEMEHILTPEIEKELAKRLGNPTKDPHDQAIPPCRGERI